jgi:predicted nucleotidyltransferase
VDLTDRRAAYARELALALDDIVARLSRVPEVERILLFGSYARGRCDLMTDLDVIVVMDSSLPFVERLVAVRRQLEIGVDLDLLVYTPAEFEGMKDRPFLRHALRDAKVLYARQAA